MVAEGGFRARAGTLSLYSMVSDADREVLRTLLAELATGAEVQELETAPRGAEEHILKLLNDTWLVEPADPALGPGTPIGPDTPVQPTPAGHEFAEASEHLERWLGARPAGEPTEQEAGEAVATLVGAWSATVAHALAAAPLTVAEACAAVPTLDDRRVAGYIAAMEEVGLVEAIDDEDGETRHGPTEWLRRSIAPLCAMARLERRHPPGGTAPIALADVEAGFHLALGLVRVPGKVAGSCGLAVELDEEVLGGPAELTAHVEDGRVVALERGLDPDADARATAPAAEWLDAVIDGARVVEMSGEVKLARYLVKGLHETLFGG